MIHAEACPARGHASIPPNTHAESMISTNEARADQPFADYAAMCEAVASTTKRNEKIRLVAEYLRAVPDEALPTAAAFASGDATPPGAPSLRLGGSLTVDAAREVFAFDDKALREAYDRHGDLGGALADVAEHVERPSLFAQPLTLQRVATAFADIAAAAGSGANRRRSQILAHVLSDATPLEVKYLVKLVTGDMRIGLKQALTVDALAAAYDVPGKDVRRALMAIGDLGPVAGLARAGQLEHAGVAFGKPIGFMLASPLRFGSEYKELEPGEYLIEDKFDGIRVQAHCDNGTVRLFSRRLNDVSRSYPEIVEALRAPGISPAILDGELLAFRDGRAMPFARLQGRLQRKDVDAAMQTDVPLALVVFDILAEGDELLFDRPLGERRSRLEQWIATLPPVTRERVLLAVATFVTIGGPVQARAPLLEPAFDEARARGNEGLMVKSIGSAYTPGRRGRQWFKLKKELATLDCVVVAVEYGHGKRNKVLSDYTFAVRDGDKLATIGKAYSGLTDAEIASMTQWFLDHTVRQDGRRLVVEPEIVVEIAFDIIQRSALHDSGLAMRFPRVVRLRPDKGPSQSSTLTEALALVDQT
jgi:DNA ligase-1